MAIETSAKKVTFRRPFTLPSVGRELPAGRYTILRCVQTLAAGDNPVNKVANWLILPDNDDGPANRTKLSKNELEEALLRDNPH